MTIQGDEIAARSAGFRRLAGFIFGANSAASSIAMTAPVAQSAASSKIAMTAPVAQTQDASGAWTISFYMPAQYTQETLPRPNDKGIVISEVPAQTYAVYRFSGIPGRASVANATDILRAALVGAPWQPVGAPLDWFYDPPWTLPWLRRNEVALSVTQHP